MDNNRNNFERKYAILAGDTIRPNMVQRVTIVLFEDEADTFLENEGEPVDLKVSIRKDGMEISQASHRARPGSINNLLLKIPSSTAGDFRLRIEGNHPNSVGGTTFEHESGLYFSPQFLFVLVQLNKPVYNGGDVVLIRSVMLKMDLKPFNEPVDIYIKDPNGYIMRRWLSRQANTGVAGVSYILPSNPLPGLWEVSVDAQGQQESKKFLVEKHWPRRFEVFVRLEPFILETEDFITGTIDVAFTHDLKVRGLLKVSLKCKERPDPACEPRSSNYTIVNATQSARFYASSEFQFPMDALRVCSRGNSYDGIQVEVEAVAEEYFSRMTSTGFCRSRIIRSEIKVRFLASDGIVFKPGMPFSLLFYVSYHDKQPLDEDFLYAWENLLSVTPTPEFIEYKSGGLFHASWRELPDQESNRIRVTFTPLGNQGVVSAELVVLRTKEIDSANVGTDAYLHLSTSTQIARINEYVIFHARTSFFFGGRLYYVITSKNSVVHSAFMDVPSGSNVHTFSVAVSSEMTPSFRLVAFMLDRNGILHADSVTMPVDSIQLHSISVAINERKDFSMNTVEAAVFGESGALFCLSALRLTPFQTNSPNELSKASVLRSLHAVDAFPTSPRITKRFRSGEPDEVQYHPSGNYGPDAARTFKYAGLKLMTNLCAPSFESEEEAFKLERARSIFLQRPKFCDLMPASRIAECPIPGLCHDFEVLNERIHNDGFLLTEEDDDITWFRLKRYNRYNDFFNTNDDWGWVNINISPSGDDMVELNVPKTADTWVLNAFAVSAKRGISFIDDSILHSSLRPFYFNMETPEVVRSGEQFSVRIIAVNNLQIELYTLIILADSKDYKFVHIEEGGYVESYNPRTSNGEHQHLVILPPNESMEILIPIVATVQQGDIEVVVTATTQVRRDKEVRTVTVRGEGVAIGDHISMLLNLENRANVYEFMDIKVDESPIVPYQQWRRYVHGSTSGYFAVSGDVVGPAFPSNPAGSSSSLDRPSRTTDHFVYEFAANVWTLKYLRLTNQFEWTEAKTTFGGINVIYAAILQRFLRMAPADQLPRGGLKISAASPFPSVWLTAWAVRHFHEANFPDWQNFVHIDTELISAMVNFLLVQQNQDFGFFEETDAYLNHPLVSRMVRKRIDLQDGSVVEASVPLTANVLIALHHAMESIKNGNLRARVANAKIKGMRFLEYVLPSFRCSSCSSFGNQPRNVTRGDDPNAYVMAMMAYALTLTRSSESETAFRYLHESRRENRNGIYWSTAEIQANQVKSEFNRPFIQAKDVQMFDSLSVEATAYALLVYIQRDGINSIQGKMVRWLNSMRIRTGGFAGILDSTVAAEALTEYSFRARLRGITDMLVTVEATGTPGWHQEIRITNKSVAQLHKFNLENVWGHLNVIARGRGQAIIQLDYAYGVDYEPIKETPPADVFTLDVRESYRDFRNKSIIDVELCPRYTPPPELDPGNQEASGAVTIEVENPSGYLITQREATLDILRQKGKPENLVDVRADSGFVHWYFSKITRDQPCLRYTIRRWFPVANLTKTRSARIYETHEPEKFYVAMFYPAPLYALDVCAVCGSYQCPYCPIYSRSCLSDRASRSYLTKSSPECLSRKAKQVPGMALNDAAITQPEFSDEGNGEQEPYLGSKASSLGRYALSCSEFERMGARKWKDLEIPSGQASRLDSSAPDTHIRHRREESCGKWEDAYAAESKAGSSLDEPPAVTSLS
ncbi:unnamed protein product [Notodromas monacha]|uniref:CD109 antigen n=1 Tax=Notodromas monacha TaxID=399045 RepID=A0A7R9G9W8_9CRUS|nr:unnamed protein product [Notodromas monacha]CAG0913503.1 unnamed protein product [Notodromas monacha]